VSRPKTVTGYEPRFDYDIRRGKVGEEYVGTILEAIQNGSVEVKTDYGSNKTGNVFVEFEQKAAKGEWKPSGIASSEAEFWAYAFKDGAIFIKKDALQNLCKTVLEESPTIIKDGEEFPERVGHRQGNANSNSTRGVKLPVARLAAALKNFGKSDVN